VELGNEITQVHHEWAEVLDHPLPPEIEGCKAGGAPGALAGLRVRLGVQHWDPDFLPGACHVSSSPRGRWRPAVLHYRDAVTHVVDDAGVVGDEQVVSYKNNRVSSLRRAVVRDMIRQLQVSAEAG